LLKRFQSPISRSITTLVIFPNAPWRYKLTHSLPLFRPSAMSHRFPLAPFSVFATTPCRGLSLSH